MTSLLLLLQPVKLEAYPDLQRCERVTPCLGGSLLEVYGLQGIRWGTAAGYVLSCVYFYAYRRPRASFADRRLLHLHHYLYPSAAVAAPVGLGLGVARGVYEEEWRQLRRPAALAAQLAREEGAAAVACAAYQRRRAAAAAAIDRQWPLWRKLWWGAHTGWRSTYEVKLAQALQLRGLAARDRWQDFLLPHSLAWVRAQREGAATAEPPPPSPPGALTALQADYLASRVLQLRHDKSEERWCATASRLLVYGAITMLVAWNSGGAAARLSMGVGAGVTAGSVISALRLDETFSHV
ncbi:hypothetical protein STCU_06647 [Strigomonas culicis]|uniref:Uncharacterized protein n=1 Tax=Strigomonas culicis TaxID=28005 RepID=S9VF10_9TRYP|nr:hypothetical protein STCU_06647 [Strigomonas culicis]|eukprot:EPY25596.1 hypothetical protein STCU_06647 [Strigomonas culicis]